jgi:hypothetical protein
MLQKKKLDIYDTDLNLPFSTMTVAWPCMVGISPAQQQPVTKNSPSHKGH